MLTTRRAMASARLRLPLLGCLAGAALACSSLPVHAQGGDRPLVPDPSTWGTEDGSSSPEDPATAPDDPGAPETGSSPTGPDAPGGSAPADTVDARPPVAKMVWRTVTTPGGRTFQVLEPASPEEVARANAARRTGDAAEASPMAAGDSTPAAQNDVAMMGDLGRPAGRRTGSAPTALSPWQTGGGVPGITAFGVYGGYASTAGLQATFPADGTLAFRMGLTGFPGLGWLWTPGLELRFGQEPGTFSTNGVYGFSNLYVGETVSDEPVTKHWGLEMGAGYRWILPDRRAVRWIAAIEVGGRWETASSAPKTPAVRAFWMIAAP